MADEADRGNDRAQEILDDALARRKPSGPPSCGYCHYCNAPLVPGSKFCDAECRNDWDYEQRRRSPQVLPCEPDPIEPEDVGLIDDESQWDE